MTKLTSIPGRLTAPGSRISGVAKSGSGFSRQDGRSATKRGYGADWVRLRKQILAAEPLCRFCTDEGRTTAATEVDHIQPFNGLADPLRLAPWNCRPLCQPCHRRRTARQSHGAE